MSCSADAPDGTKHFGDTSDLVDGLAVNDQRLSRLDMVDHLLPSVFGVSNCSPHPALTG